MLDIVPTKVKNDCLRCHSLLIKTVVNAQEPDLFETFIFYLCSPTDKMFYVIKSFEKIFQHEIVKLMHVNGIKHELSSILNKYLLTNMTICEQIQTLIINTFLNMGIFYFF